jgi:uncharacterized protein (TIGR03067 family)
MFIPRYVSYVAVCLVGCVMACHASDEDAAKSLNGVWQVRKSVGDLGDERTPKDEFLIIAGGSIKLRTGGKEVPFAKLRVDATASPSVFDMTVFQLGQSDFNKKELEVVGEVAAPGIYKLDGDTLTICYRDAGVPAGKGYTQDVMKQRQKITSRPTTFDLTKAGPVVVMELVRSRP